MDRYRLIELICSAIPDYDVFTTRGNDEVISKPPCDRHVGCHSPECWRRRTAEEIVRALDRDGVIS